MLVRDETSEDAPTVFAIHEAAFPTDAEARLVDALRARYVVVLGEPAYYQRFGFRAAHLRGIRNEYQAQEEFMIMELVPGGIPSGGGVARYRKEFSLPGPAPGRPAPDREVH
jgi:predicted N-acetyltransferase YhbS